jgi:ketosteroid isomerase-like protein
MSQANVENLRAFLNTWTQEAWSHEGVRRATERWIEPYEWLLIDVESIVGATDTFVSSHRVQAKARHTGIEFDLRVAYPWTFRDGKVSHLKLFFDPGLALKAAGLAE